MSGRAVAVLLGAALALLVAGCGYRLGGTAPLDLPPDIRTLALVGVDNPTLDTQLPQQLRTLLRDEITDRGALAWTNPERADGLMRLKIDKLSTNTRVQSPAEETLKFQTSISLSATIIRRVDRQQIWSGKSSASESFFSREAEDALERTLDLAVRELVDLLGQAY